MGKDVSNSPAGKQEAANPSSFEELTARLDQLESMLIHTRQKRMAQSFVVWTCTVLLVAVCAWFLISFTNLMNNYDTEKLFQELQSNSAIVVNSPQFRGVMMDMQDIFIPAYKKALVEELNARSPQLQATAAAEIAKLKKLLLKKLQDSFIAEVHKDFEKVEKDLLKRYPDMNSEKMNEAYKKASELFAKKLAGTMEQSVVQAKHKLAGLDETFRQFKKDKVYGELRKKTVSEVESLLLESMLELWIYELNPAKGAKLANK